MNFANIFTKYLDHQTIEQHVARSDYIFATRRTSETPTFHNVNISIYEYEILGHWKEWEWLHVIKNCVQTNKTKTQNQENMIMFRKEIQLCESGIQPND